MGFALRREDLRGLEDAKERLSLQIREEASASFDLEQGPLIRGRLIGLADEEHVLLITMHHIVSDGWSMGVLTRELSAFIEPIARERTILLAPLAIQYADYAAWQREWLSGRAVGGAERLLAAERSVMLRRSLSCRRTGAVQPSRTLPAVRVGLELDEALTQGLKDLSQRHGLTLFMTVLAGWALVLSRLSNQEDVVIGTPSANRGRLEIEGLIGFFVNTLALRVDLSGAPTVKDLAGAGQDSSSGSPSPSGPSV